MAKILIVLEQLLKGRLSSINARFGPIELILVFDGPGWSFFNVDNEVIYTNFFR